MTPRICAVSPCRPSGEQVRAGGGELHEGAGVMQFQPAPCYGELQAGTVFRGRALVAEQERAVELLDIDSAILNRFEGVRVLQQAAGGLLRVGVGAIGSVFHAAALSSLSDPRRSIFSGVFGV